MAANEPENTVEEQNKPMPVVSKQELVFKTPHDTRNSTARQARMIQDIMRKGKRHFGVSAASLTHMQDPARKGELPEGWDPKVLDVAIKGERDTTKFLKNWMADKPAVVLIDSMHIPGAGKEEIDEETGLMEGGDTDHILIIGEKVIVIDTKAWKKKAEYTVHDNHTVLRNKKEFPGGNVKIDDALHMWFDFLDDDDVDMFGAIFIDNGDEEDPKTHEWSTRVFRNANWYQNFWFLVEQSRMGAWLDEQYREIAGWDDDTGTYRDMASIRTVNPNLIAQVVGTCMKPYTWAEANGINLQALRSK